jgi:drug/metabolite transporter (DMT)-like permease
MRERTRRRRAANLLMLITTCCWAGNPVAGKQALLGFPPLALAQIRVVASATLLCALMALQRGRVRLPATKRHWFHMVSLGFTGIALNQVLFISGLARTSALHAGLIAALGPLIVLILSVLKRQESFTRNKAGGMALSFLGVVLLLTGKTVLGHGGSSLGDLTILAGTAVFSFYTTLEKQIAGEYDDFTLNAIIFGIGAVLMVPFTAPATLMMDWHSVSPRAWLGFGYLVIFGSVVAYLIYGFALSHLPATRVAAFTYLQPVLSSALAVFLVDEQITKNEVFGGALILAGIYIARERMPRSAHSLTQ